MSQHRPTSDPTSHGASTDPAPSGRRAITSPALATPAGPFSHAVRAGAERDLVYLSGQVGQDPDTGALVAGGTAAGAERALLNVAAVLAAAGLGPDDVVKANVYLADMRDFAALNAVYARHFRAPYPARTTVAVAALPLGARVEVEVVARARADEPGAAS
jgi:2-iminobutanoate/2-iminopropanoate deaminase